MSSCNRSPTRLRADIERWPLLDPLRIAGYTWEFAEIVVVTLERDGRIGRGEAAGVYYRNERATSILRQIEAVRDAVEAGLSRDHLQKLLAAGGARNALDCALWDLDAKETNRPAWQIAGEMTEPKPLLSTFTCGAASPAQMAVAARRYAGAKAIKLKLTGEPVDAARVLAVRESRPDVWLGVDGNQSHTRDSLERLLPALEEARVRLIEQPFPVSQDAWLDEFRSPIPVGADESVQTLADIPGLVGRFAVMNIKLDKCGGLTEGLAMARIGREHGLEMMVGSMLGTSLAMAPGFLVGQLCSVVDLDGAIFLRQDRESPVQYTDGYLSCPEALWGYPSGEAG